MISTISVVTSYPISVSISISSINSISSLEILFLDSISKTFKNFDLNLIEHLNGINHVQNVLIL